MGLYGATREDILREGKITPGLVAEVADKVYAMLLSELGIERERYRLPNRGLHGQGGR